MEFSPGDFHISLREEVGLSVDSERSRPGLRKQRICKQSL